MQIIARSLKTLVDLDFYGNDNVTIIETNFLETSAEQLQQYLDGVSAVVSCLGHTINFQGLYGAPRDLCTASVQRIHEAVEKRYSATGSRCKFILMNTVGVADPSCDNKRTWGDILLLRTLRYTLPPHRDNENTADYLRNHAQRDSTHLDWVIVRPDSLIDKDYVTDYDVMPSPITTIVSGRDTSRINVANFMVELIDNPENWNQWKFRMPVISDSIKDQSDATNTQTDL